MPVPVPVPAPAAMAVPVTFPGAIPSGAPAPGLPTLQALAVHYRRVQTQVMQTHLGSQRQGAFLAGRRGTIHLMGNLLRLNAAHDAGTHPTAATTGDVNNDRCVICLDDLLPGVKRVVTLPCGHSHLCVPCAFTWYVKLWPHSTDATGGELRLSCPSGCGHPVKYVGALHAP